MDVSIEWGKNPFSDDLLNQIFKIEGNRIKTRESSTIEFKKSFNWSTNSRYEYSRAFGSFANNKGGYLIFGINDKPRELLGLQNSKFYDLDEAEVSTFLNEAFSCELRWAKEIYELNNQSFGIFYVYEADNKPVIFRKNFENMREGDIYYRYRGKNERIRYTELKKILDFEREKFTTSLFDHLSKIIQIGVGNVAILDTLNGQITGKNGQIIGKNKSLLIDDSLIPQLKIVNGEVSHNAKGDSALKLVGNVEGIKILTKNKHYVIRTEDIILAFLNEEIIEGIDPIKYIEQIAYETTWYLPIYFFIHISKMSKKEVLELIESSEFRMRANSRKGLIGRLKKSEENFTDTKLNTNPERVKFKDQILKKEININNIDPENLGRFLEAITHLNYNEITSLKQYILGLLKSIMDKYYATYRYPHKIRKTICYVDYILYSS